MLPLAGECLPKRQPRWLVTRPPRATAGDADPQTLHVKSRTVIYSARSACNEPVISGEDAEGTQVFCAVGVCKQLGGGDRVRRTPGGPRQREIRVLSRQLDCWGKGKVGNSGEGAASGGL